MSNGSICGERLVLAAPAKINLHLRVGPVRTDGFHPLLSWMATIDLCDQLTIAQTPTDEAVPKASVRLACNDPSIPTDDRNLVVRAVKLLAETLQQNMATGGIADTAAQGLGKTPRSQTPRVGPVSLYLEKRVPAGGGLGGGSSDAATTLIGLNQLWNAGLTNDQLADLAAKLGSDIPFFLYGPSSVIRGRGEHVEPFGTPASEKWVVLMLPPIAMPTPDVYRQFDRMNLGAIDIENSPPRDYWLALSAAELLPHLVNDLEPPAFALRPDLGQLRANLEKILIRPVRMSGSGSSLFTLYDTQSQAESAAAVATRFNVKTHAVRLCPV